MLLVHASKTPNPDVVVKAAKSGGVISIEAVNHRAGWRLAFEQGPLPDFATEDMSSESAILSVCKVVSAHIDINEDGVPDAHFEADSALAVENAGLKEDLAAARLETEKARAALASSLKIIEDLKAPVAPVEPDPSKDDNPGF